MCTHLTTARLVLNPISDADFAELHAILTEPGVRRYLCDDVMIPQSQTRDFISRSRDLFAAHGGGLWGVRRKAEPELLGCVGFWYFHEPARLELLFAMSERVWRRGYAREAARRMIEYGREHLGMRSILASTDTPNLASIGLLEGLGFALTEQRMVKGLATAFFELREGS
jgi:ribosomal-protein-alanine N-acetyltransferase